jgi:carboxymethylenebutenolidase
MTTLTITTPNGSVETYVATPEGPGPWPGVVVIHDALGMSNDARRQTDWLASEGYLAACPDLFNGKDMFRCMRSVLRDFSRQAGPTFDKVDAVREYLERHEQSTGRVGVIGFCFGGGFALMLAPKGQFDAASVNYGPLPSKADEVLTMACPIVGSYGANDRTLRGAADRLDRILSAAGIAHDVHEYPDTGHAFLNDHSDDKFPFYISALALFMGGGGYHEQSAKHARQRIRDFFARHLKLAGEAAPPAL